jgi:DNA-binding transcriptional ArsR family regulator
MMNIQQKETLVAKCTTEECRLIAKTAKTYHMILSDEELIAKRARLFQALGNETRLRILGLLSVQEMCTCDIVEALEAAASTISHHLRMLEDGGLISSRRVGKFTLYSIYAEVLKRHRVFD